MALGSSAPEILLSVIETGKNLGKCPGELGPSTIVGSAAFNLLVISAVAIYSVNESNDAEAKSKAPEMKGVKKIDDMGVFAITATFSVFSYIWLYIVLMDQNVTKNEAIITFILFFVLIFFSYGADKFNKIQKDKNKVKEGAGEEEVPFI